MQIDTQWRHDLSTPYDAWPHFSVYVAVVLQLIVDGKSNKECAGLLGVSVNTVAAHRTNIMEALGIHKTAQLVVYAIRAGLVKLR